MKILCGKTIAEKFLQEISSEAAKMAEITNRMPKFAIIQVGKNPASEIYIKNKKKTAEKIGFGFELHEFDENTNFNTIGNLISELNLSKEIDGIIVQLPIPSHLKQILYLIAPNKDIDGLGYIQQARLALNLPGLRPCTPFGVIKLLKAYEIDLNCRICVVGRSVLVGQSLALMLLHENATVTIAHSKTRNIGQVLQDSDIICLAAGAPNFVTSEMVNPKSIVIDIAISKIQNPENPLEWRTTGDLHENTHQKIAAFSPVPGGIGPMTVASLMYNTLEAHKLNHNI